MRKKHDRVSGIYRLYWDTTDMFYVGGSKSIIERFWDHRSKLKLGTHPNRNLVNVFKEHGFPKHEIMERCDIADLINREQFYIDVYCKNSFCCNIATDAQYSGKGVKQSIEHIMSRTRKMSIEHKEKIRIHREVFGADILKKSISAIEKYDHLKSKKVIDISNGHIYRSVAFFGKENNISIKIAHKILRNKSEKYMFLTEYLDNKGCTLEDFLNSRKAA